MSATQPPRRRAATRALSTGSGSDPIPLVARRWPRVLLVALAAAELGMALNAPPALVVVGAGGAVALLAAGTIARSRPALLTLVALGSVPFAVLAWTAVVPVLLLLVAVAVALPLARHLRGAPVG